MKSRFQPVRGSRWVILGVAARASRMRFTVRRLMVGIAVVAGSVSGCAEPGPDTSRLSSGSEAILYEPNATVVEFIGQSAPPEFPGDDNSILVKIPVGTRVQVNFDTSTNLVKDRGVGITVLEGEHKGQRTIFPRYQLRPATPPWTHLPKPAADSKTSPPPSDKPAADSENPPSPSD